MRDAHVPARQSRNFVHRPPHSHSDNAAGPFTHRRESFPHLDWLLEREMEGLCRCTTRRMSGSSAGTTHGSKRHAAKQRRRSIKSLRQLTALKPMRSTRIFEVFTSKE